MLVAFRMDRWLRDALLAKAERELPPRTDLGAPAPATIVVLRLIEMWVRGESGTVTPAPSETTREAG